jgi:hypothetical protein
MMADMAENALPPGEPPTPPTGQPALPAGAPPSQLPVGLDADEYRRFQEYQRFQDYQRFVQQQGSANLPLPSQPPPGTPQPHQDLATQLDSMRKQLTRIERVTNPPAWLKLVRNKWLRRAVFLLVVAILLGGGGVVWSLLTVPSQIAGDLAKSKAGDTAGALPAPKTESRELPLSPNDAVAYVYLDIAQNHPDLACFLFDDQTAARFARAFNESNCQSAATKIESGLTDPEAYATPNLGALPAPTSGQQSITISSCSFDVSGGPRLGVFALSRQPDSTWEITGYSSPAPCPSSTSAPTPTT